MDKAGRNERRQVVSWIKEKPENLEKFAALRAQYVFSGMPNRIRPDRRQTVRRLAVNLAVALALPLLIVSAWLLISKNKAETLYADASHQVEVLKQQASSSVTYYANPGTKGLIMLPDSSIVRLNGASSLTVPSRFEADSRELFLSGEGYFEIRHFEDWPMNIHTSKGVIIKVLGTTFDLSAYDNDGEVKLTLIEGKVVVKEEKSGSEHVIRPLQEIKVAAPQEDNEAPLLAKAEIKKANVQLNTAWVNGELIFNNTPMPEIVKQLERWYGVHVHVTDPDILNYRLTATFTTESITRVLDLIRFSSMLQYDINGTEVFLRKDRR
jgi:ferric-dicitrate binding protein FerR (iron transport regulator)